MKAADTKAVATQAKESGPFFKKERGSDFFRSNGKEQSFFTKKSFNQPAIQAKLNVGRPNDHYEKEADSVADQVVQRMGHRETGIQRKANPFFHSITPLIQTKCAECEKEEKLQRKESEEEKTAEKNHIQQKPIFDSRAEHPDEDNKVQKKCADCEKEDKLQKKSGGEETSSIPGQVQKKPIFESRAEKNQLQLKALNSGGEGTASHSVESQLKSNKGGGAPLSGEIKTQMESSIGADFSQVRIHSNSQSVQMSKDLNAQAFTHGNDIYFNSGKFDTGSVQGKHLLAHELTHTIQQGGIQAKKIQSETPAVEAPAPPVVQRKEEEEDESLLQKGLWALVKGVSPEVHDILRYQGFTNWAKEKIGNFVNDTVSTISAPIKLGAEIIEEVKGKFHEFSTWLVSAAERIKKGDCTPFIEASQYIQDILDGITGPALEKLKAFLAPIKAFIDKVWNDVGKPIWDFVSKVFGAIWDAIKWVADKVWTFIKSQFQIYVDLWHWFAKKIGFEGDDQDSLWEQIKRKVKALWDKVLAKLEPYKTQLMIVGGIILLLSPAGPFILAAAALTGIMFAATKIRHYLKDREAIIQERGFIKGVLIPGFFDALHSVSSFLKAKVATITGALKKAVGALHGISKDLGESFLSFVNGIVDWLTEKFESLSTWAEAQLEKLVVTLQDVFARIVKFLQPITDILSKVGAAIADYYKLPFLVADTIFHKIPKCIRDKIIAFLTKYVFKHIPILREIKDVEAAWTKMEKTVMGIIDLLFVKGDLMGALWQIFNLLLDALNFPKELAVKVYNKAFDVFDQVIEKPKLFFVNLLITVKMGLSGFFDRKWVHLKNGFTSWLFGAVEGTGIYVPKAFTFSEIFKMLGTIFSMGMEKVYKSIAKKKGQDKADQVRAWINGISKAAAGAWKWLKALHENSLDETIEMISEKGAELLDLAIDSIIDWIVTKVIEKISQKLITMLDPTGIMAVVNSLIAFYNAVETAIEEARKILEFVDGVLDNVTEILGSVFDKAAAKLEDNLEKAIPLFLEFLANQLSMGKLGKKIKEMADKADKWIDEKVDWLVDKAFGLAGSLLEAGKAAVKKIAGWLGIGKEFDTENGPHHTMHFKGQENNRTLVVASDIPEGIEIKVDKRMTVLKKDPKKNQAKIKALSDALQIKSNMDTYINKKIAAQKPENQDTSDLQKKIDDYLEKIKDKLIIGGVDIEDVDVPLTNVTYEMQAGKAHRITAKPLTKLAGNTQGSDADGDPVGWKIGSYMNRTRKKPGQFTSTGAPRSIVEWKRVHLLSAVLHGPGTENWNLTPTNDIANGRLRVRERAVFNDLKSDKGDPVIYDLYETNVEYNHPNKEYQNEDAGSWNSNDFPSNISMRIKKKGEAEKNIPIGGPSELRYPNPDDIPENIDYFGRFETQIDGYFVDTKVKDRDIWSVYARRLNLSRAVPNENIRKDLTAKLKDYYEYKKDK